MAGVLMLTSLFENTPTATLKVSKHLYVISAIVTLTAHTKKLRLR